MTEPAALLLAHFSGYLLQFRGALIAELVARGYRTVVAVPGLGEGVRTGLLALGAEPVEIAMSRTGLNPLADLAYAKRVGRLMRDVRPQLVIATGIKPILHGIPAAKAWGAATRVPLFAGLGSMIRPESSMHRALAVAVSPLVRRAIRCSTHVVTQNEDDSRVLATRFAAEMRCPLITTCGSGVDLAHYRMESMRPGRQVLMTSRIVPEKGVAEFFAAAGAVRQLDPDVSFRLAGFLESSTRGLSRAWLDEQCRVTGVRYVGHVEDIRPLMAESSMLVLPSYAEGRPRAVQEALAMGRPVVTTDAPGCRDAIVDGVHGRIVPTRDARALAGAIADVLGRAGEPNVPRLCRQYAEQRYCATRIAADLLAEISVMDRMSLSQAKQDSTRYPQPR
jgi:glycosyltransferase involved in cell wall biosynthesis